MQDSKPRTWRAAFLRGQTALIPRCRNTKQNRWMAQLGKAAPEIAIRRAIA
jgi:hypothetical protein